MITFSRLLPFVLLAAAICPTRVRSQEPTQNPHGKLTMPCSACHTADGWTVTRVPQAFRHAPATFPLGGAHAVTGCRSCHRALDFSSTPLACASCHRDVHQGELGTDCSRCHSDRGFVDRAAMIRQHQTTRFILAGTHVAVDCEDCHQFQAQGTMQFVNTPTQCDQCHQDRFLATRTPDHRAGGFPRECSQCHGTALWTPARFNHEASRFALTGAHRAVACDQCHATSRFTGTPSTCVDCHLAGWQGTTNPSHQALGFPQECQQCHTTTTWPGAVFDHAGAGFALTGAHRAVACDQCHANNVLGGTPTTCHGCHADSYTATRDPAHQSAGFSTECVACHNSTAWTGARYSAHDAQFFPIYGGSHAGRWSGSCATCHTNPASYAVFTCLNCHLKPQMDSKHDERAGYSYDSNACYRCHPRGSD